MRIISSCAFIWRKTTYSFHHVPVKNKNESFNQIKFMFHNMVHKSLSILTSLPPSLASLTISLGFILNCPALTKFLYLHIPYAPTPLGTHHAIHLYVLSSVLFLLPEMNFFPLLSAHPTVTPKLRYIALWRYHKVLYTLNHFPHHIVLFNVYLPH